jgi:hypothetical protein
VDHLTCFLMRNSCEHSKDLQSYLMAAVYVAVALLLLTLNTIKKYWRLIDQSYWLLIGRNPNTRWAVVSNYLITLFICEITCTPIVRAYVMQAWLLKSS